MYVEMRGMCYSMGHDEVYVVCGLWAFAWHSFRMFNVTCVLYGLVGGASRVLR